MKNDNELVIEDGDITLHYFDFALICIILHIFHTLFT